MHKKHQHSAWRRVFSTSTRGGAAETKLGRLVTLHPCRPVLRFSGAGVRKKNAERHWYDCKWTQRNGVPGNTKTKTQRCPSATGLKYSQPNRQTRRQWVEGDKGVREDQDDAHGSSFLRSAVAVNALVWLLVPTQEKEHGATSSDREAQMHKADPGECDYTYKTDKSVWMECGTASITYFHTKVFAVHVTIHFDRNKDFHWKTLDEVEERAETSALWGPHST